MRGSRNNGAILVLLWVLLPFAVCIFSNAVIKPFIIPMLLVSAVSFPVVGCLSDVCLGRYKTIRYSLWMLWLSLIVDNVFLTVKQYATVNAKVTTSVVESLIGGCMAASLSGVMANTLQFGIDQLIDASSSDICSYISWYIWTVSLGSNLAAVTQYCFCGPYNNAIGFYILPLLGTAVIFSDMCFSNWLVKEPAVRNPFKIIFQVLRYAVRNKYPRLRSAFTYWEDKPFSRIELGKAKYGGPFTTEEVEDVKTFFRILGVIAAYSPLSGLVLIVYGAYNHADVFEYKVYSTPERCNDATGGLYMSRCYKAVAVQHLPTITITAFVPIFEFLLYPVCAKCRYFNNLKILNKLVLGIFMLLLYELSFAAEKAAVTFLSNESNSTCFLYGKPDGVNSEQLWSDYTKFVYQQPLLGIAIYVLFTSAVEFICAQSPYSMKGVLMGISFVAQAASVGCSAGLLIVIKKYVKPDGKCGIWLHAAIAGALIVVILVHVIISRCYKFRERDEVMGNEQMFAENYFDKYLTPRSNSQ